MDAETSENSERGRETCVFFLYKDSSLDAMFEVLAQRIRSKYRKGARRTDFWQLTAVAFIYLLQRNLQVRQRREWIEDTCWQAQIVLAHIQICQRREGIEEARGQPRQLAFEHLQGFQRRE